jgi:hypothetical protein
VSEPLTVALEWRGRPRGTAMRGDARDDDDDDDDDEDNARG